jgi:hypothetical protein
LARAIAELIRPCDAVPLRAGVVVIDAVAMIRSTTLPGQPVEAVDERRIGWTTAGGQPPTRRRRVRCDVC